MSVKLGGEAGHLFRLKAGDMLVLPAGVGHRRVGGDDGLRVIGAYPPGQSHFDMKRRGRSIPKVPLPSTYPFYGDDGPLVKVWSGIAMAAAPKSDVRPLKGSSGMLRIIISSPPIWL